MSTTDSSITPLSLLGPDCWVVCPSIDSEGIEVQRAWLEVQRRWWQTRTPAQRMVDEQPAFSLLFRSFPTEAEALTWKSLRDGAERLGVLLCHGRGAKRVQPTDRIVLPGFFWPRLRGVVAPPFTGLTFTKWVRRVGFVPRMGGDGLTADEAVEKMVAEAELEFAGQVAPQCFLLNDKEFDKVEKDAKWKLPGEDPWHKEAKSAFDAIVLRIKDLPNRLGPLPLPALAKFCTSWQLHWHVVEHAHKLMSSKTARKLGIDTHTCREAGWHIRVLLNRYAQKLSEIESSDTHTDIDCQNVAQNIRQLRNHCTWTQEELSARGRRFQPKFSRESVSRIENGTVAPSGTSLWACCSAFNKELDGLNIEPGDLVKPWEHIQTRLKHVTRMTQTFSPIRGILPSRRTNLGCQSPIQFSAKHSSRNDGQPGFRLRY